MFDDGCFMPKKPVCPPKKDACPQLPGTILRVFIPAGAVINLLNIIELTSPSGICLIIRLPIFGGKCGTGLFDMIGAIRQAGGTVEFATF